MTTKLEKFLEVKKVLEDTKAAFQPLKGIGDVVIERSFDRGYFEKGISRILEGVDDALEQMDDQTIGFLNREIGQTETTDEED